MSTSVTLTACAMVLLLGCGPPTVQFTSLAQPPHPLAPRQASSVEVLTISPGRAFVEIGTVAIYMHGYAPGESDALAMLRQDAANRGCDALVLERNGYSGACVVYTDLR
jgi:hypothetical protein